MAINVSILLDAVALKWLLGTIGLVIRAGKDPTTGLACLGLNATALLRVSL